MLLDSLAAQAHDLLRWYAANAGYLVAGHWRYLDWYFISLNAALLMTVLGIAPGAIRGVDWTQRSVLATKVLAAIAGLVIAVYGSAIGLRFIEDALTTFAPSWGGGPLV